MSKLPAHNLLMLACTCALLAGCGLKGDLYLEDKPAAEALQEDTTVTDDDADEADTDTEQDSPAVAQPNTDE